MKTLQKFYDKKSKEYCLGLDSENIHQKILQLINKNQTILDIGCATGYLGAEIKKKGNRVYGVEISEKMAKEAKKILDEIVIGNIEEIELPWPEKFFDIIICADILEHLFDPEKVLISLKRYLKDNGLLIVSIPNVANWSIRKELLFGRFNYQAKGLLDEGHVKFFTYDSAKKMIERAGYKTKEVDLNITLPKILWKINKILKIIPPVAKKYFPKLFGYQFLFIAKKL
jgi:2-polyprenyl-3-methyl-5-hydroxy-6-metoxy-1,4-benzoquinol methylase